MDVAPNECIRDYDAGHAKDEGCHHSRNREGAGIGQIEFHSLLRTCVAESGSSSCNDIFVQICAGEVGRDDFALAAPRLDMQTVNGGALDLLVDGGTIVLTGLEV